MLDAYPDLHITLLAHYKKPNGRGQRAISDVVGEWGRWADVVMLVEADGDERTKLTVRKRTVERRIVATRRNGLLVEPRDVGGVRARKVPLEQMLQTVEQQPGLTMSKFAAALQVSRHTAIGYVDEAVAAGRLYVVGSARGAKRLYLAEQSLDGPVAT